MDDWIPGVPSAEHGILQLFFGGIQELGYREMLARVGLPGIGSHGSGDGRSRKLKPDLRSERESVRKVTYKLT